MSGLTIDEALHRAAVSLQNGNPRAAVPVLAAILRVRPLESRALHLWGIAARLSANLAVAAEKLRRSLTVLPNNFQVWTHLGVVEKQSGALPAANRSYQRAIVLLPSDADAFNNLANALVDRGETAGAARATRRAVALSPRDGFYLRNLVRAASFGGEPADIVAVAPWLTALNDRDFGTAKLVAEASLKAERPDTAYQAARLVLARAPDDVMLLKQLGMLQLSLGQFGDAEAVFKRAMMIQPGDPAGLIGIAWAANGADRGRFAESTHRWARIMNPDAQILRQIGSEIATRKCHAHLDAQYNRAAGDNPTLRPPSPSIAAGDGGLLGHIAERFRQATLVHHPFTHAFVEDVLPDDLYRELVARAPQAEPAHWKGSRFYPDRANVPLERGDEAACWTEVRALMMQRKFQDVVVEGLGAGGLFRELQRTGHHLTGNVKLTFDRRNYVLGPHRDHVSRFISCLFFLPFSDGNPEIGTSIYRPLKAIEYFDWGRHHPFEEFELLKTFPYKPNACLAFLNFGKPYHGVQKVQTDAMRRLLQYTLYITPDGKPQPDLQR